MILQILVFYSNTVIHIKFLYPQHITREYLSVPIKIYAKKSSFLSLPDQLEKVVVGISLGMGHLTGLDNSRTKAYCICSSYGFFLYFCLAYHALYLSPSVLEITGYRLILSERAVKPKATN